MMKWFLVACAFALVVDATFAAPLVRGFTSRTDPERAILMYDPADGWLELNAPRSMTFTGVILNSSTAMLVPENLVDPNVACRCPESGTPPCVIYGIPPNCTEKILVLSPPSNDFPLAIFGPVLPPALSEQEILGDLDLDGSLFPGGSASNLGDPPGVGLYYVAEPTSCVAVLVGMISLLFVNRRN